MNRKPDAAEPLLNTVARKLGQAAGTLVNMTQQLAEQAKDFPGTLHPVQADRDPSKGSDSVSAGKSSTRRPRAKKTKKRTTTKKTSGATRRPTSKPSRSAPGRASKRKATRQPSRKKSGRRA